MENVSSPNTSGNYLEQEQKAEGRIIAIIAVVVMIGFALLLGYMFFGNH